MARRSGVGSAVSVVAAGAAGLYAFRVIRQLRRRAINPDLKDPARNLMRWLQVLAVAVAALIASVAAALIWWQGPAAIVLVVPIALLVLMIGLLVALYLWVFAEGQRRTTGFMICEVHYPDAPRAVKASMRRIYRASHLVQSGSAFSVGIFGDLPLDRLVYSAAERAVVCSELVAAIRHLRPDAVDADRVALEDANTQIRDLTAFITDVELALERSADSAKQLSVQMAGRERRREASTAASPQVVIREDCHTRARSRLDEARDRARTMDEVDINDVADRIQAVQLAYQETAEIANKVLYPEVLLDGTSTTSPSSAGSEGSSGAGNKRKAVLREVAKSATRAGRSAAAAARTRVRSLRNKNHPR